MYLLSHATHILKNSLRSKGFFLLLFESLAQTHSAQNLLEKSYFLIFFNFQKPMFQRINDAKFLFTNRAFWTKFVILFRATLKKNGY